jgi:hypothetical protein
MSKITGGQTQLGGATRFSSSNQFSTKRSCVRSACCSSRTMRKRPSAVTSYVGANCPSNSTCAVPLVNVSPGSIGAAIIRPPERKKSVVQRRKDFGFALEPGEPLDIGCERIRQNLDRDGPLQIRVRGTVDLAHAAHTDLSGYPIRAEAGALDEPHMRRILRGDEGRVTINR